MRIISRLTGLCAAVCLAAGMVGPAHSQARESFLQAFGGSWVIFDPDFAARDGALCRLELGDSVEISGVVGEAQRHPKVTQTNCAAPLDKVAFWDIEDNQLTLFDTADVRIASMGGTQIRVTGELSENPRGLILERLSGSPEAPAFAEAVRKHRCIYAGYSDECADRSDLSEPSPAGGGVIASVEVLVQLNVRRQPRGDADILGTLPAATCLRVNYCTTASDGVWCRARFGEINGWVRKTALRQGEWPVMTYRNSCPDN